MASLAVVQPPATGPVLEVLLGERSFALDRQRISGPEIEDCGDAPSVCRHGTGHCVAGSGHLFFYVRGGSWGRVGRVAVLFVSMNVNTDWVCLFSLFFLSFSLLSQFDAAQVYLFQRHASPVVDSNRGLHRL